MLKFKEDEYRNSMKLICEARVDAETLTCHVTR